MRTSDTINELAGALAKARGEMKNPVKNQTVNVKPRDGKPYTWSYSDLTAVLDASTPALSANGLALAQAMITMTDGLHLTTRLIHTSGQWIESSCPLVADLARPQTIGSALTYLRRYSITALLDIASDDDDDANAAQGNEVKQIAPEFPGDKPVPAAAPGFPPGNPRAKVYKSDATTPKAAEARHNNDVYAQFQREIDDLPNKAEGYKWKSMRWRDIDEHVSPDNMWHLSERFEARMAALP